MARSRRPPSASARRARRGRRRRRCRARPRRGPRSRRRSRAPGRRALSGATPTTRSAKWRPAAWRTRTRRSSTGSRSPASAARIRSSASPDVRSISTSTDCHGEPQREADDEQRDEERRDRVGAGSPAATKIVPIEDGERARQVGAEVQRVGGERGRAVAARARGARRPCARRRCAITRPRTANDHHVASTPWPPPSTRRRDRLGADREREEQQHRALPQRGEVLGLAVAVVVLLVGRADRDADGEERQQRGDEVRGGVRRLGEEGERAGGEAGAELERDQEAGGDDAEPGGARARGRRRLVRVDGVGALTRAPRSSSHARQRARGAAAVRDRVLLGVAQLGHRAAVGRVGGQERRVVAEAAARRAPRPRASPRRCR